MDTALKQRLVGASVLIALAVIVLPMLLGGRPDGEVQESQKIELPPQPPGLDFETRRYPIGEQDPQPQPDSTRTGVKSLPTPGPATSTTLESAPDPASEPLADTAVDEETQEFLTPQQAQPVAEPDPATPQAKPGRYVVQVASFGAADNANRLSQTLRSYGYTVLLDSVKSDVGTLHRVRVGPFGTESEANSTATRIQTQVGDIKPRVMDLQPDRAAQVTEPSDPLVRWIVQVGSFSSTDNADKLVARLRLESMAAYKEAISSSGTTIYRVRVGPFLEREEAIKADKLIMERMSIDGVVMSSD